MPVYQTPKHLADQQAIADQLERAWSCTIMMTPDKFDGIDALAWRRGQVVAVIEIRRRNGTLRECYPTHALIDVHKVLALDRAAMEHPGCKSLYVIQFDDQLVALTIDGVVRACPKKTTGRKDRNDPNNINPAYVVPVELLRRVRVPDDDERDDATGITPDAHRRQAPVDAGDYIATEVATQRRVEALMAQHAEDGSHDAVKAAFDAIDAANRSGG